MTSTTSQWQRSYAYWCLGLTQSEDLVAATEQLMSSHIELYATVGLTMVADWPREQVEVYARSLQTELGLTSLSLHTAADLVIQDIAERIVAGTISEDVGAHELWRLARLVESTETKLRPFIGLASEMDDHPEHKDYYKRDVQDEAHRLLQDVVSSEGK